MTLFDGLVAVGPVGQQHPQMLWGTMGGGLLLGPGPDGCSPAAIGATGICMARRAGHVSARSSAAACHA